jgi:integrase/recombinase XerD
LLRLDTDSIYAQPERDRAIVLALVDTMARVSAFCRLRVEDLKPDGNGGGQAIVVEKGGCEHRLFFSSYSWGAIQELLEVHPLGEGPLFVSYNTGDALTPDGVRQLLHRLGERAGIENVYPHRLGRRTGATLRSKDGCTNRVLMQLGGWKTEKMLRKYINLGEEELAEVHTATSPLKHLTIPSKST